MKYKVFSVPAVFCLVVALILGANTLGAFMRETDQAWLLDGGMAIAKGHPQIAMAEFNYDKQFVSYHLVGLLFRCLPRPFTANTLVYAANVFGFVFFWGALWLLLARSAARLSIAVLLPIILTPAFLVYSSFYASAFTSAALVFLLATFLARHRWNWFWHLGVFSLAFLAVGARADAIFVLPLLAMLHSPQRRFSSVVLSVNTWLMAAGGLTAFFLGRALYLTFAVDYAPATFHLKPYLGFVAFGLGASALLLLMGLHAIFRARHFPHRRLWLAFLWLALAFPMAYYSLQLLSPRHCVVGAISVVIFVCARRGRALFQSYFHTRFSGLGLKLILVAAALIPVFVGINLSNLHHPKITFLQPTLIPSGAGVAPMGGYLGFVLSVQRQDGLLDHNHAIWSAARDTKFKADATGTVPYLFSPIESYFKFAIRLQNEIPRHYNSADLAQLPGNFYCESRSFMRYQFVWPNDPPMEFFFANYQFTPATGTSWHGLTVWRGQTNGITDHLAFPAGALWALNESFGPDEFRWESISALNKIPADWAGKKMTLAGHGEFRVKSSMTKINKTICGGAFDCWQLVEFPSVSAGELVELPIHAEKIYVGVSAYPAWMTLKKN